MLEGTLAITNFIRRNPRMSAIAAFSFGLYAATIARKGARRGELRELPGKLVGLVPSMHDLLGLLATNGSGARRRSNKRRRVRHKASARVRRVHARGTAAGNAR